MPMRANLERRAGNILSDRNEFHRCFVGWSWPLQSTVVHFFIIFHSSTVWNTITTYLFQWNVISQNSKSVDTWRVSANLSGGCFFPPFDSSKDSKYSDGRVEAEKRSLMCTVWDRAVVVLQCFSFDVRHIMLQDSDSLIFFWCHFVRYLR